ncbi:hypothetical protein F0562_006302 [Nyssa sinensis]|uniref:Uncharacterized protein n=1 Tax=Nyssa sinensis TaxID=561372 RepID=A0A5J5AKL3_9ASTE|nr:hypothetical protein F0562_006302 [Nyssa sinensis]
MEKLLKPYDKEYMKMAMLKHEETFKQQVYELHRLYKVQKILMKSMGSSGQNGQNQDRWEWDSKNVVRWNQIDHDLDGKQKMPHERTLDLELPAEDQYIGEPDGDGMLEIEEESEIELTLGLTSYCRREIKAETPPLTSDSGLSFSSSSSGSNHLKRTSWRTQQRTDYTKEELNGHSGRRNSFDVEEQLRQDGLKQPPWLFQALSLNMT